MKELRAGAVVVLSVLLLGDAEGILHFLQGRFPRLPGFRGAIVHRNATLADVALRWKSEVRRWPNRSGPQIAAFDFHPSEYRELAGFRVTEVVKPRGQAPDAAMQSWRLEREGREIRIQIHVHPESTAAAQDEMLDSLQGNSNYAALGGWISLGEREGVSLGDVCLIYGRHPREEPAKMPYAHFTRNNVRVHIDGPERDVLPLARAIDARIRAQPARWPGISPDTPGVSLRIHPSTGMP